MEKRHILKLNFIQNMNMENNMKIIAESLDDIIVIIRNNRG